MFFRIITASNYIFFKFCLYCVFGHWQKDTKKYGREVDIFPLGLIYFELIWKLSAEERKEVISSQIHQSELITSPTHTSRKQR